MIIWLPERMHRSAANKLLKMIEEPPPNTIFLLVTENTDLILPTILSRTQKVKVPRIDDQSLFDAISDHFGMDSAKSQEIVHLANGSYIDALYYTNVSEEEKENFNRFVSLMRLSYGRKVTEIISWVDNTAAIGRENIKLFLDYATRMVRENFMMNLDFEEIVYLTEDEKEFSQKFAQFINENNAKKIYNEFNKAYRDIEMNANAKVVFLDLSIKLMKLLRL